MSVLSSIFGKRPARERPDLEPWIVGCARVLVVDGSGPGVASGDVVFPGRTVLRHETTGGTGLPFHFPDPRRLAAKTGEFQAVALVEVLDKIIDVGAAGDEATRVLVPGGALVVVQSVAPDDFEQRAIWNAIAKMRDPRHASTPSARQLAAQISSLRMETVHEAAWEEAVDPSTTLRPELADRLALMTAAAVARGATDVIRDGAFVVPRRAWRLRGK